MISPSLHLARYLIIGCVIALGGLSIATEFEKPPVKYIFPFDIVEKEGGYKAGDDLLVQVHFCFAQGVNSVHYKSITQTLIPANNAEPIFTEPILDLTADRSSWIGNGMNYTDESGYECFKALGAPKKIPVYTPSGCYTMNFVANVEGRFKDHEILYHSKEFCIEGNK